MSEGAAKRWMAARGWQPFAFQQQVWQAMAEGRSGLLHATTGAGKTYAVWLGALERFSALAPVDIAQAAPKKEANKPPPLTVLWITPMRALAADSLRALQEPLPDLAPHWSSGLRTGDTASGERAAQDRRLPTVLVTTPESVSLLLARADARERLASVQLVVVDEWHELVGNKRGVQVQLALARLSGWNPRLLVWGMSATLGNLPEALATLVPALPPRAPRRAKPLLVQGRIDKALQVQVLLPERVERFAWAGHMGLSLLPQVVQSIEATASTLVLQHPSDAEDGTPPPAHGARRSPPPIPQVLARTATPRGGAMASGNRHARGGATLLFTNTRSQAERWYQALLEARPDWAGTIALHHGSLSGEVRGWVEAGLKAGTLKAVVCTSSLDLGVDFLPVEQVLQIGSAKGVARLVQRAGRSGHAPGRTSSITLVPTHSLELVEAAAARQALAEGRIEDRHTPRAPLDVLVQHLVTIALGGGFVPDALLAEVRRAPAYATLADNDWQWALQFVRQGGASLANYPDFHRVVPDEDGVWRMPDARLARRHRSNIGTIVSDASMQVQFVSGGKLGSVEESFIARLKPGDVFMFAGRLLELVRTQQMTAYVRTAPKGSAALPRWNGGRMPLSNTLADAMLRQLEQAERGVFASPEMRCAQPLLALCAEELADLVARVFDTWTPKPERFTLPDVLGNTQEHLGEVLQKLQPGLKVLYGTDTIQTYPAADNTVRRSYGWFQRYSLLDDLPAIYKLWQARQTEKKSVVHRAMDKLRQSTRLLRIVEILAAWLLSEVLVRATGTDAQFQMIDFRLMFVMLIGTVYGMNFDVMPELHWEYGYPVALSVMVAFPTVLYLIFKRRHWL